MGTGANFADLAKLRACSLFAPAANIESSCRGKERRSPKPLPGGSRPIKVYPQSSLAHRDGKAAGIEEAASSDPEDRRRLRSRTHVPGPRRRGTDRQRHSARRPDRACSCLKRDRIDSVWAFHLSIAIVMYRSAGLQSRNRNQPDHTPRRKRTQQRRSPREYSGSTMN